jgi:hypothetical protein
MDDVLEVVCGFLNHEGMDYVVVGGLAVIFHGIPRTTMDADIILQIEGDEIPRLVEFLKENGFFASLEDMRDAFREKTHCTVEDKESMIRLDLKGVYNEMDRRTFSRKMDFDYKGTKVFIASAEDTIANKLVFGSEQDLRDAEGIYVRQMQRLDMDYLEEICKEMGVQEDLKRLKKRVKRILKEVEP